MSWARMDGQADTAVRDRYQGCSNTHWFIVHVDVLVDEDGLYVLDEFDRDDERDWHDVLKDDEACANPKS